jgi:hypothetical protein
LRVENVQIVENNNYPLSIEVNSTEEINIRFSYNASVLKREYVNEIRDHFENVFFSSDYK